MTPFRSIEEKKAWLFVLITVLFLMSSLFLGNPALQLLNTHATQASVFFLAMILIPSAILLRNSKLKVTNIELYFLLGFISVFIMFFVRLGIEERTHMIEYSVLTLFVYKAYQKRMTNAHRGGLHTLLIVFVLSFLISLVDEILQHFVPNRFFDWADVLFNSLAILFTLGIIFISNSIAQLKNEA